MSKSKFAPSATNAPNDAGASSADDVSTMDMPRLLTDDGRAVTLHMDGAPMLIVLNPGTHPLSGPARLR